MATLLDALEFFGYFGAFWLFVFSPPYRRERLKAFAAARWSGRAGMVLTAVIALFCGMLPLAVLYAIIREGAA